MVNSLRTTLILLMLGTFSQAVFAQQEFGNLPSSKFDPASRILSIPSLEINGVFYRDVSLRVDGFSNVQTGVSGTCDPAKTEFQLASIPLNFACGNTKDPDVDAKFRKVMAGVYSSDDGKITLTYQDDVDGKKGIVTASLPVFTDFFGKQFKDCQLNAFDFEAAFSYGVSTLVVNSVLCNGVEVTTNQGQPFNLDSFIIKTAGGLYQVDEVYISAKAPYDDTRLKRVR